ncbi:DUF938 domain-containing protein [Prochlorococcus marinus]|uniref:DUF938 domain-containing protein n=1 Tax=Prochlorococcus marinus TaxID=1219 RepID=UPI0022B3C40D|nr:DUF938 domain-containing protein [Prochlorococcus marinus]
MDERLFFPATERNKDYIGDVLAQLLPKKGSILEIASGSGQHGVTFQKRFSSLTWHTSDPNPEYRKSINAWINHEGLSTKMPGPINLDVAKPPWPLNKKTLYSLKAIVCINMIHIAPLKCAIALFQEAKEVLGSDSLLILYGPFKRNGKHTSSSNELFDQSLQVQNPSWGVRDLEEISELGEINRFKKYKVFEMPANNLLVTFQHE